MIESPIPPLHISDLEVRGLDADGDEQVYADFVVRTFELRERICEPYSLMLSLATRQRRLHVRGLVGGRCLIRFGRGEFERDVHGVVFKAETIGVIQEKLCVRLFVAPAMEVLSLSKRMRVFQGRTAIDIVKDLVSPVFATYGGTIDTSRIEHATFRTRDCCVQYDETDFEFVQRLLAEEGIAFSFRHGGEAEELVLLPMTAILHSVADEDDPDPRPVPLCPREPELAPQESIQNLQGSTRMRARGTEAAMWDWKANPPVRVSTRAEPLDGDGLLPASNARFGEVYAFESYRPVEEEEGGPLFEDGLGEATMLGHQQRLEDVRASGYGNVCGFTDGATFEVAEHPTEDLEGLYVLLSVVHHAELDVNADGTHVRSTASYGNRFTCYRFGARGHEGDYEFAPESRPKPLAHGPMMATVVGPPGEEIHTDEHGRVKVRLHWDRGAHGLDDHERSCWVPVGQTWAGPGFGTVFVPRVGMEVVISFVSGDPDRPLCTGVVYNGQNRPPYSLPDEKTRSVIKTASSPGGQGSNELSFEDAAGAEEVYLHAQRDLVERVEREHRVSIGAAERIEVGGSQTESVGGSQAVTIGGAQSIVVKGKGSDGLPIAPPAHKLDVVGAIEQLASETILVEAPVEIVLKCAGSELRLTPQGISLHAGSGASIDLASAIAMLAADASVSMELANDGALNVVNKDGSTLKIDTALEYCSPDQARLRVDAGHTLMTPNADLVITDAIRGSAHELALEAKPGAKLELTDAATLTGNSSATMHAAGSIFEAGPSGTKMSGTAVNVDGSAVSITGANVKLN